MVGGWARGQPPGTAPLYRIRHSMEVARGTVPRTPPGCGPRAKKKPGVRRASWYHYGALDQSNLYCSSTPISRPIGLLPCQKYG